MPRLSLFLLGPPRLEQAGHPLEFNNRKVMALLTYLAVARRVHNRDALATLLWPASDQAHARAALRSTIWTLNKIIGPDWLEIERETVCLREGADWWIDVEQFSGHLAACQSHGHPEAEICPTCLPLLTEAVKLYRDKFLAGFSLRDSPDFDDWQSFETERLGQELTSALARLVQGHSALGKFETAIGYARRWLAFDPLYEPAHRHLMQLYAWSGQPAAALRQYQECVRLFEQELDAPPSVETSQLYQALRANQLPLSPRSTSTLRALCLKTGRGNWTVRVCLRSPKK